MSLPRQGTFQVDPVLTNLMLDYGNRMDGFIASKVFPVLYTNGKLSGRIKGSRFGDRFRVPDTRKGDMERPNKIDVQWADDLTFALIDRGLTDGISDRNRNEMITQIGIDPLEVFSRYLTDQFLLDREDRVATLCTSGTYLTNYAALTGTDRWDDNTSDPIQQILDYCQTVNKQCGMWPNKVIMGREVFTKVRNHPVIRDAVKYTQAATGRNLTPDLLAQAFDVKEVLVGDALYATTKEGQTVTLGYRWGKNVIVAYIDPQPSNMSATVGTIFSNVNNPQGFSIQTWYEEAVKGTWVNLAADEVEKVISARCAYLLNTVIS